ncbi:MAG: beta-lactamase-like [uncultured Solirubrobacteraceae bacterium]|uniref:Beta-lactamase-like n=1 Tax=uncultured Solirubrobacteraceae bacterium TaxID=1162706 RepID=A0A6J4TKY1_9ACTN|nr:MAG: beta-lactamase-like [uncultured Solirubrobacteraceae bacterium]
MSASKRRELGRGERVVPGVWRLRLPLPWPGVPHCNAWALAAGDGIVLVDTGMHEPGSLAQLERAMEMVGLRLEHVRLLVCTHAHADHCGQAAAIVERAGCELWMHPNHAHLTAQTDDPEVTLATRMEVARQSGVPEEPLRRWAEARKGQNLGIAGPVLPDRDLVPGVTVQTDLGDWTVHETPGHAPSHVCLHQAGRRILLSGDHLLGRVSLYFDYGWTPDPVGEFLASLDAVDQLDGRLALSGHGRPFTDVRSHVEANRALVRQRLHAVRVALADGPSTAYDLAPRVYGPAFSSQTATWLLTKLLCYLTHLEAIADVERLPGEPERWGLAVAS